MFARFADGTPPMVDNEHREFADCLSHSRPATSASRCPSSPSACRAGRWPWRCTTRLGRACRFPSPAPRRAADRRSTCRRRRRTP
jgi:hypothetical protein